jgi:hypothetical protein
MKIHVIFAAACVALGQTSSVVAHHSFAMFDRAHEVTLGGVIRDFQWTNPHTWIQLLVTDASGAVVEWSLEGGSPSILSRGGWNRLSLKPGEKVSILINPLKSGEPGGSFLEVHKADGSILYYHG